MVKKQRKQKKYSDNFLGKLLKFWDFVWNDDSILSWVLSIVIAFLLIKFIIYPALGLVLETDYPVVAIVSGSMEHKITSVKMEGGYTVSNICGNFFDKNSRLDFNKYWIYCGSWYKNNSISRAQFLTFPFKKGMNIGDVIVLRNPGIDKIKVGDVIVFIQPGNLVVKPIIHRVVSKKVVDGKIIFQTKGDHNEDSIKMNSYGQYLNEYDVTEDQVIGKSFFRIPYVGYVKIWAYNLYMGLRGLLV